MSMFMGWNAASYALLSSNFYSVLPWKTETKTCDFFLMSNAQILDTPSLLAEGSSGLKKNIFKQKPPAAADASTSSCCWFMFVVHLDMVNLVVILRAALIGCCWYSSVWGGKPLFSFFSFRVHYSHENTTHCIKDFFFFFSLYFYTMVM